MNPNGMDEYVSGVQELTEARLSTMEFVAAKAQPKESEAYVPNVYYDKRYEKGWEVSAWIFETRDDGTRPFLNGSNGFLENGALDLMAQASAAITLAVLSLNIF